MSCQCENHIVKYFSHCLGKTLALPGGKGRICGVLLCLLFSELGNTNLSKVGQLGQSLAMLCPESTAWGSSHKNTRSTMDNHSWKLKSSPCPHFALQFPGPRNQLINPLHPTQQIVSLHCENCNCSQGKHSPALLTWAHTDQPWVTNHLNSDLLSCNLFWLLPQHQSVITLCMYRTRHDKIQILTLFWL